MPSGIGPGVRDVGFAGALVNRRQMVRRTYATWKVAELAQLFTDDANVTTLVSLG